MSVKNKIIQGFAWESTTKLVVQVASWVSTIYVARLLSPDDYGAMAIALVVTHILNYLLEMGLADGLIQRKEITRDQIDGVFYLSILMSVFLGVGLYLLAPILASFYRNPVINEVLEVLSIAIMITGTIVMPRALVLRELDFKYRSLVDMAANFASIISVVVLATLGYGIWSLVYAYLVLQLTFSIGFFVKLNRIPTLKLYYKGLSCLFNFGYKLMLSRLLTMIQTKADVFIAGRYLKADVLGYYTMAVTFSSIPAAKIGTVFNSIAFPAISRVSHDLELAKNYYIQLQKYLALICIPVLLGMALIANEFVIVLLTEKWLPVVEILQVLSIANIFVVLGMMSPQVWAGLGKSGLVLKYNVFVALLLPCAVFVGVLDGVLSMSYFLLVAFFISYLLVQVINMKVLKMTLQEMGIGMMPILVANIFMVFCVMFVKKIQFELGGLSLLSVQIAVGGLSYLAIYVLFFRSEVKQLINGFRRLRAGAA